MVFFARLVFTLLFIHIGINVVLADQEDQLFPSTQECLCDDYEAYSDSTNSNMKPMKLNSKLSKKEAYCHGYCRAKSDYVRGFKYLQVRGQWGLWIHRSVCFYEQFGVSVVPSGDVLTFNHLDFIDGYNHYVYKYFSAFHNIDIFEVFKNDTSVVTPEFYLKPLYELESLEMFNWSIVNDSTIKFKFQPDKCEINNGNDWSTVQFRIRLFNSELDTMMSYEEIRNVGINVPKYGKRAVLDVVLDFSQVKDVSFCQKIMPDYRFVIPRPQCIYQSR